MPKFLPAILLFFLLDTDASAQPGHYREVVLEISDFSLEKHTPMINFTMKPSLGESYISLVCEANGWVVLALDLNSGATEEQLLTMLKPTGISFLIKKDATAEQVKSACKGPLTTY